jgi:AcrR family transcriptional regulator
MEAAMAQQEQTRWRRRKEARPAEILEAALACFSERGFAATRLEEVAARAGVTKGTIYLYYPSKEDLFKAAVRSELVPIIERLEVLLAEPITATVFLQRLVMSLEAVVASRPSVIPKLVFAEAGNFPELARFYLDTIIHPARDLLATVLRRGVEQGEFRPVDVDHVVYCVIGPFLFTVLWKHSLGPHDDRPLDISAVFRAHIDLLLHGLQAQGTPPAPRPDTERKLP